MFFLFFLFLLFLLVSLVFLVSFFFWFRSSALPSPSNLRQIRELKLQLIIEFPMGSKQTLAGNWSFHFSQVNYIYLFIFVVDKDLSKNGCLTHATTVLSEGLKTETKNSHACFGAACASYQPGLKMNINCYLHDVVGAQSACTQDCRGGSLFGYDLSFKAVCCQRSLHQNNL